MPLELAALAAALGPLLITELLLLGIFTGFLAGLLGVGGGMVMVPFLTFILSARGLDPGLAVKMAIATAMATIVFTSLSSVRAHHRLGSVRWDIVKAMAPGIVTGGLLAGAGAFAVLRGAWLAILFAVFAAFSAWQMLSNRRPRVGRGMPSRKGQFLAGSGIGFASGLVGAGGAFMSVPFMVWCNVPMRLAVGTSAAFGFPIAAANTVGYAISGRAIPQALPGAFGYLYLPALAIISLASVMMAPLGARVAHRMDVKRLRAIFALLQISLAATMIYKVLRP